MQARKELGMTSGSHLEILAMALDPLDHLSLGYIQTLPALHRSWALLARLDLSRAIEERRCV